MAKIPNTGQPRIDVETDASYHPNINYYFPFTSLTSTPLLVPMNVADCEEARILLMLRFLKTEFIVGCNTLTVPPVAKPPAPPPPLLSNILFYLMIAKWDNLPYKPIVCC